MSDILKCSNSPAMIETDCKIKLDGHEFESGGSYLMLNKKDKLTGILYRLGEITSLNQYENKNIGFVGSWDGKFKIKAYLDESTYRLTIVYPIKREGLKC